EEGAHEKSPKCLGGNLGDFRGFCKGLSLYILISAFFVPLFPINPHNLKSRHSRAGGNPVL
ncbi:TPA: hypothetical protein ACFP4T_002254, partial [Neisseria meningitidis]